MEWHDDRASELFDDDYVHFYESYLEARSDEEAERVAGLLQLAAGDAVLDAPCGHGRIANRLAARGCAVTGLDGTPAFLERAQTDAKAAGLAVEYVPGDLRELPWEARFDAALCWFTSYGYFDDAGNRAQLAGLCRALKPGGRLLLEQLHREVIVRALPGAGAPLLSLQERGDDLMLDRVWLDPVAGRTRTERIIVRDGRVRRVRFSVAVPTFPELAGQLRAAGFGEVSVRDEHGEALRPGSRRMVVLARRAG